MLSRLRFRDAWSLVTLELLEPTTPCGQKLSNDSSNGLHNPAQYGNKKNNYVRAHGVAVAKANRTGRPLSFTRGVEPSIAREPSQARSYLSHQHHNPRTDPCRSSNFNLSLMKTGRRLCDRHAPQLVQRLLFRGVLP
jgi:hypothetical protein